MKFYFTVVEGAGNRVSNANVEIDKYDTANGTYTFNSNRMSDSSGQFIEYLIQDNQYRFIVNQNGLFVGTVDKAATCTASPCEITLQLNAINPNTIFDSYNSIYANNTNSTLTFDPVTKIVTYTFMDLVGTAHYFKLVVDKMSYNTTTDNICNLISYTTSGVLTCNMTNYDGDFVAKGYISRSPDRPDKVLSFFINALNTLQNSPYALLFLIGWLITITFGAMAVSRGNPATTLAGFMIAWTSAKFMQFNPFSWVVIVLVDLLGWWLISEIGT